MSCQPLWERVIELAEQARKEALGADPATNVRNTDLVRAELEQIDEQCGNATERDQRCAIFNLDNELDDALDETDELRGKLKRIREICY